MDLKMKCGIHLNALLDLCFIGMQYSTGKLDRKLGQYYLLTNEHIFSCLSRYPIVSEISDASYAVESGSIQIGDVIL